MNIVYGYMISIPFTDVLACNIMFSLLFDRYQSSKSRLKKRPFGISGQNEEISGKIEELKRRKNSMQPFFSPLIQVL